MRLMQIKATSYCFALFYLERILYIIYVLLLRKVEQFYKDMHIDTGLKIESRNPHVVMEKKELLPYFKENLVFLEPLEFKWLLIHKILVHIILQHPQQETDTPIENINPIQVHCGHKFLLSLNTGQILQHKWQERKDGRLRQDFLIDIFQGKCNLRNQSSNIILKGFNNFLSDIYSI